MTVQTTDIQAAPLPFRNDTILGVCEGIGQDFGFNANWLRLVFASTFYFAPLAVVGTYLGLGLLVAASRYFAPDKQASAAPQIANYANTEDFQLAA